MVVLLKSAGEGRKKRDNKLSISFCQLILSSRVWLYQLLFDSHEASKNMFGVINVLIVNYSFRLNFEDTCPASLELWLEIQILSKCPRGAVVSEE